MEMNLHRIPVPSDGEQAVSIEVLRDIIPDLILVQILSVNQHLRIIAVLKHSRLLSSFLIY